MGFHSQRKWYSVITLLATLAEECTGISHMDERQRIRLDICEKIALAAKSESEFIFFLKNQFMPWKVVNMLTTSTFHTFLQYTYFWQHFFRAESMSIMCPLVYLSHGRNLPAHVTPVWRSWFWPNRLSLWVYNQVTTLWMPFYYNPPLVLPLNLVQIHGPLRITW